jgi:diadenylate cyclase
MTSLLHSVRVWDAVDLLLVAAILYGVFAAFKQPRALQLMAALGAPMLGSSSRGGWGWRARRGSSELLVLLAHRPDRPLPAGASARSRPRRREPALRGIGREGAEAEPRHRRRVEGRRGTRRPRMGALIVMERGQGLGAYADLGVPLDALVSADLLLSLFLPYSPLHDGAVLIREDRIVAAGCFLPLSRNAQIGRTRHPARAALGLAEESDAVVLAVSEETGRMSLAVDGDGGAARRGRPARPPRALSSPSVRPRRAGERRGGPQASRPVQVMVALSPLRDEPTPRSPVRWGRHAVRVRH